MSEVKNPASLADLLKPETNSVKYDTVEVYGTTVRIGSVSSADMLEWLEGNQDPAKKKRAGLRLLVKSVTDDTGSRYPEDQYEAAVEVFAKKDAQENGKLLARVMVLNGFPLPGDEKKDPAAKND